MRKLLKAIGKSIAETCVVIAEFYGRGLTVIYDAWRPGGGLNCMKGENDVMKNLLKAIRENFVFACEAYYNTFVR